MKHLLICRHAKSPWAALSVADYDRERNDEGSKEASDMGARLLDRKVFLDLILTSSATRALTTSQLIASEIKYPLEKIKTDKKNNGKQHYDNDEKTEGHLQLFKWKHNGHQHILRGGVALNNVKKMKGKE